jgi:hypothetical protein
VSVQRWRNGRDFYRPAGEAFDPRAHDVAEIPDDTTARAFVVAHHYSRSYPAARRRFGLYARGQLVGVAVFSVPMTPAALRPLPPEASLELGRFVLLDDVKANGESWFFARCREALARDGFAGVVAFSDPMPRRAADGTVVLPGHVGTIYQASNAVYLGRATARTLHLLPDGTVVSPRALQKIRAGERGWRYAVAQLEAHGATPLAGDPRAWLREQLPRVARTVRHQGNHKYAIGLARAGRRALRDVRGLPYPKNDTVALSYDGLPFLRVLCDGTRVKL